MVGMDMFELRSGFIDQDVLTSSPRSKAMALAIRTIETGLPAAVIGQLARQLMRRPAFFRIAL
jgi:hypothetical protein